MFNGKGFRCRVEAKDKQNDCVVLDQNSVRNMQSSRVEIRLESLCKLQLNCRDLFLVASWNGNCERRPTVCSTNRSQPYLMLCIKVDMTCLG